MLLGMAKKSFAVGVDLGGTNLRVAAVDDTGLPLETRCASTGLHRGRDAVVREMCAIIQGLIDKFSGTHAFWGTGVGVPGIIDIESGTVRAASNLPGWNDSPVKAEIQHRLGTPVILENDANCAALGEKWIGAGRDTDSICMVTLGTGVGGGFIFHGKLWHGMIGMAGEIGHMTVAPDGPQCACGNRGCLERYASATAVSRMIKDAVCNGHASEVPGDSEFSAEVVFQRALQGDPVAKQIFQTVGWALGVVLSGLIDALNLPMYVIAGGVSSAWEAFSPALFSELRRRSIVFRASDPLGDHDYHKKTIVTRAVLGSEAGLIGAARLPMLAGELVGNERNALQKDCRLA